MEGEREMSNGFVKDFYRFGGSFAAQARLALIAEELGRFDLIPKILDVMKRGYAPWVYFFILNF